MSLFDVAILEHPTKKETEEGNLEKLVFGPVTIVAKDAQSAGIVAVMDQAKSIKFSRSRMRVLIRPFGKGQN